MKPKYIAAHLDIREKVVFLQVKADCRDSFPRIKLFPGFLFFDQFHRRNSPFIIGRDNVLFSSPSADPPCKPGYRRRQARRIFLFSALSALRIPDNLLGLNAP
jgi:hypothetical protein